MWSKVLNYWCCYTVQYMCQIYLRRLYIILKTISILPRYPFILPHVFFCYMCIFITTFSILIAILTALFLYKHKITYLYFSKSIVPWTRSWYHSNIEAFKRTLVISPKTRLILTQRTLPSNEGTLFTKNLRTGVMLCDTPRELSGD